MKSSLFRFEMLALLGAIFAANSSAFTLKRGDLLVACDGASQVVKIDPLTGAQTSLLAFPGRGVHDMDLTTDGVLYILQHARRVTKFNLKTGSVSELSALGLLGTDQQDTFTAGLALGPSGEIFVTVYTAPYTGIVRIDPVTGQQTLHASGGFIKGPVGIALAPGGKLIVADVASASLVEVDATTGAQRRLASGLLANSPWYLAIASENLVYVGKNTPATGNTIQQVNPITGAHSSFVSGGNLNEPIGIALDLDGQVISAQSSQRIVRINPVNKEQTVVSKDGFLVPVVLAVKVSKIDLTSDWDKDAFIEFGRTNFVVPESTRYLTVPVRWRGPTDRTVTATLTSINGTASAGTDFVAVTQTVTFNPGDTDHDVQVEIRDNPRVDGDRSFPLHLSTPTGGARLPENADAQVMILDNDTTTGPAPAVNWPVLALVPQTDGKFLIGGNFSQVQGLARNGIARMNPDGSLDATFDPGSGVDNWVLQLALQSDGKILIGGVFSKYNGVARPGIARVNSNGSLDTTFNPGIGVNGEIYEIIPQADGKTLIAGNFTQYNGVARARICRLNANGSLDSTFNPGTGPADSPAGPGWDPRIWAMTQQADGRIILSGDFATFNGAPRSRIARLNSDGSLDNTFQIGTGLDGIANVAMALSDGKILLGGWFYHYNGAARNRILRLNSNGALDATFNAGEASDLSPYSLAVQTDGRIIVGGGWQKWNGQNRGGIVRLNSNGTLDSSFAIGRGAVQGVDHGWGNASAGLLPDGRIAIAGDFELVNGRHRERVAVLNADGSLPQEQLDWKVWSTGAGGNGHIYALTSKPGTWTDAEAEAVAQGGHLVTVRTVADQSFLQETFLRDLDRLRPFWIGLSDAALEGQFVWKSGDPLAYSDWQTGEPAGDDYAAMNWNFSYSNGGEAGALGTWSVVPPLGTTPTLDASLKVVGGYAAGPYFGIMERAAPALRISNLTINSDQSISLELNVTAGFPLVVEESSDLASWTTISESVPTASTITVLDHSSGPVRFYRARYSLQ